MERTSINGKRMTLATDPEFGATINQVRRLQKRWDYWYPRRQHNPIMAQTAEQAVAESECLALAPKLCEAKAKLETVRARYEH